MATPVALGLGGCVDVEVKVSAPVLQELALAHRIRDAELTSQTPVTDERDLVVSVLGHLRQGGGGEHFVASSAALQAFAARFPTRTTLGGTSVRAGIAMARLGVPSTLHLVSLNDVVRRLLPAECDYISSSRRDTLYPHLIVEYDRGLHVQAGDIDVRARSANRLIYVNDPANEALELSEDLGPLLRDAGIVLISGLNGIRDPQILDERLRALRRHLGGLAPGAFVYYEDAAFHEPAFSRRVRDALLDTIDVYGMNEDEMQSYLGRTVDLMSPADVDGALTSLAALIPVPALVVHTRYWSAVHGSAAGTYAESVDAGVVVASTRYCYGDDSTGDHDELLRARPRRRDARDFAATLEVRMGGRVRCVPGFDLDVAQPTTIGLGDTFVGGFLAAVSRKKATSWT
jgi:sugar/nucleoside kinase (ribokinase family)